jgi:hypothetical protein
MWVIFVFCSDRRRPIGPVPPPPPRAGLRHPAGAGDQDHPVVGVPHRATVGLPSLMSLRQLPGCRPWPAGCWARCSSAPTGPHWRAQARESHPAESRCRCPAAHRPRRGHCLEERLHHGRDAFVPAPVAHPAHQGRMRGPIEARHDVALDHPLKERLVSRRASRRGATLRTEPVGTRVSHMRAIRSPGLSSASAGLFSFASGISAVVAGRGAVLAVADRPIATPAGRRYSESMPR